MKSDKTNPLICVLCAFLILTAPIGNVVAVSDASADVNSNSAPSAVRDSPDREITIQPGESVDFAIEADDSDGNLKGTEWYLDADFKKETQSISGTSDTSTWSQTFESTGTYTVEGQVFDSEREYSSPVEWEVTVESDNEPPSASRDSPSQEITIQPGKSVVFNIDADDPDGNLEGAEWYIDDDFEEETQSIGGSSDTSSWSRTFDSSGTYIIEGQIFDSEREYSSPVEWEVTVESDNEPPSASRDSPSREVTIQPGKSVVFGIDADDQDRNLEGTEWYINDDFEEETQSISGSSDTAEESFNFDSAGTYTVEGQVFDSEREYSSPVEWEVTVESENEAPSASRGSPSQKVTIQPGESVDFSIDADDPDGNLEGTEWYIDDEFKEETQSISGSSDSSSWSRTFDSPGTYTVEGQIFDSEREYSSPVEWEVTVESDNEPPSASRDSPNREITVQPGESVDFSIDAADQNGNLEGTEWYVDDDFEEETQSIGGSSDTDEESFSFDSAGTYTIEGQVFDSERAYSSPVEWEVTVESDNEPPSASRNSPSQEITIQPGESVDFSIDAADQNGNLEGTEWYVNKDFEEETQSISGSSDTAEASFSFDSGGTYVVEGQVFDSERTYGSPVEWEVTVVENEEIDGALSFVEHPDGSYTKGETVEAEAEITNDGNVENTYYIGYSAIDSSGEEWDNDGTSGTTVTLEPGETEVVDLSWEVADNAPAGEYDSWVALWGEADPDDFQTRLDKDEVNDAFEITKKRSSGISWGEDPPQNISEDESFTVSAQGQLNGEGKLCVLNENKDSIANTIECRELSGGEFEESFTVEATDDLTFREGSSTELSFRLKNEDGTEDIWTNTRSISLEGTDEITIRALEEDGSPVSEADVQLEGVGEKATNEEGEVTFNSEIDSETRIEVVDGSGHIRESKTINPGEDTVEVEFPNLEPVQGVVLNAEGEPVEEGISVAIGGTSFEGTTDESGVFEFEHPLPTGDYTLNIEGHEDATLSVEKGVSTYELETYEKTELVKDREKTLVKGAVCGDPCWNSRSYDEEHNLSYLTGWIGASVAPGTGQFADARDLGSALSRGSETDAALSALGILSGPAAAPKAAKVTQKFLSRYGKQTQKVGKLVLKSNHIPDSVFYRAVYRGAPDSIEEVDNDILLRLLDDSDVDKNDISRLGELIEDEAVDVSSNRLAKISENSGDLSETTWATEKTEDVPGLNNNVVWIERGTPGQDGTGLRHIKDKHGEDFRSQYDAIETEQDIESAIQRTIENPDRIEQTSDGKAVFVKEIEEGKKPVTVYVGSNGFTQSAYPQNI